MRRANQLRGSHAEGRCHALERSLEMQVSTVKEDREQPLRVPEANKTGQHFNLPMTPLV